MIITIIVNLPHRRELVQGNGLCPSPATGAAPTWWQAGPIRTCGGEAPKHYGPAHDASSQNINANSGPPTHKPRNSPPRSESSALSSELRGGGVGSTQTRKRTPRASLPGCGQRERQMARTRPRQHGSLDSIVASHAFES